MKTRKPSEIAKDVVELKLSGYPLVAAASISHGESIILARAYLRQREAAQRVLDDQGETWWQLESVLEEDDEAEAE